VSGTEGDGTAEGEALARARVAARSAAAGALRAFVAGAGAGAAAALLRQARGQIGAVVSGVQPPPGVATDAGTWRALLAEEIGAAIEDALAELEAGTNEGES
jgi:hypothetical protein